MATKSKIKPPLSPIDSILELTSKILFVVMWSLVLYAFFKLPKIIPTHFNSSGQADNFGNKLTFLILPILATLIYFGLSLLNKYPYIVPTPKNPTVEK